MMADMTHTDMAAQVITFFLVLMRVGIIFFLLPFLGTRDVPAHFKIGLSVAFALLITPTVTITVTMGEIPLFILKEMLFSVTIAFSVRMIFYAIDTAGQLISNAMGISMAQVFNPELGQSTEVARLYGILAMLIFLSMDVHHYFIYAVVRSYELLPTDKMNTGAMVKEAVALSSKLFTLSIKIAAPVVTVMLITNVLLGFIYKLVPQFNVFIAGFPVYIGVGYIVMLIGLPVLVYVLGKEFSTVPFSLNAVIQAGGSR
jgi:flagellar biosynthetic protein FliR